VIVLGIDPGTAALGYGIIDQTGGKLRSIDYGCFETSPDTSLPDRLLAIHGCLTELLELHTPDIVGVERLFFSRNVQTAFAVGQARGVVLLAAAAYGVPVREATPNEVKVAVAGDGRADKDAVQRMVKLVLGLAELPRPDDAADALALAMCVAGRERTGEAGSAVGARPPARATVVDRAAIAPIDRRVSPFDRAVREALARETTAARRRRSEAAS
jgi:crossover junction endodeoxyribonuclease RuvC